MSVSRVCDQGMTCSFTDTHALVPDKAGKTVVKFERRGGLYIARMRHEPADLLGCIKDVYAIGSKVICTGHKGTEPRELLLLLPIQKRKLDLWARRPSESSRHLPDKTLGRFKPHASYV